MSNINDKLIQLAETKSNIRDAITSKGVEVDTSLPFGEYANKIKEISGGGVQQTYYKNFADDGGGYGTFLDITDDGILNTYYERRNLRATIMGSPTMPNDGTGFFTIEMKLKVNEIEQGTPNLFFGMQNYFTLGCGGNSNAYFGIWAGSLAGDGNGMTTLPIELGKEYYFKLTAYCTTSNQCHNIKLEVKYNEEEEYVTVADFFSDNEIYVSGQNIHIGWCEYANRYWFSHCSIDLKTVNYYGKVRSTVDAIFIKCGS